MRKSLAALCLIAAAASANPPREGEFTRFHEGYPVNPMSNHPAKAHATIVVLPGEGIADDLLVRGMEFDAPRGFAIVSAWQAQLFAEQVAGPAAPQAERTALAREWFGADVVTWASGDTATIATQDGTVTAPLAQWQEAVVAATGVKLMGPQSYSLGGDTLGAAAFAVDPATPMVAADGTLNVQARTSDLWHRSMSGAWWRWAVAAEAPAEFAAKAARYPLPRHHRAGAYLMRSVLWEALAPAPGMAEAETGMALAAQPALDLALDRWRWTDVPAEQLRQRRLDVRSWIFRAPESPRNHLLAAQQLIHMAVRLAALPESDAALREACLRDAAEHLGTSLLSGRQTTLHTPARVALALLRGDAEAAHAIVAEAPDALGYVADPLDAALLAPALDDAEIAGALAPWARFVAEARRAHPELALPAALAAHRTGAGKAAWEAAVAQFAATPRNRFGFAMATLCGDAEAAARLAGEGGLAEARLLAPVLAPR
jgi:hypothetical protein